MADKEKVQQFLNRTNYVEFEGEIAPDILEARRQCQLILDDRTFDKKMDIYFAGKTVWDKFKRLINIEWK